jgi:hypothetical protein
MRRGVPPWAPHAWGNAGDPDYGAPTEGRPYDLVLAASLPRRFISLNRVLMTQRQPDVVEALQQAVTLKRRHLEV